MHCASEWNPKAAKMVIRYVKDTFDFGIKFTRSKEFKLVGFSDSDWGGSMMIRGALLATVSHLVLIFFFLVEL